MKKWVCSVCGYVYEGENPPEFCPQCKAPASKFTEMKEPDERKEGDADVCYIFGSYPDRYIHRSPCRSVISDIQG